MGVQISSPCLPDTKFCDGTVGCGTDTTMATVARVVPLFVGEPYDPNASYGALEVVEEADGTMYISKCPVPAGVQDGVANRKFWGVYNENMWTHLHEETEAREAADSKLDEKMAAIPIVDIIAPTKAYSPPINAGEESLAIGAEASTLNKRCIVVGNRSMSTGNDAICIGYDNYAATGEIVIGALSAPTDATSNIRIGHGAKNATGVNDSIAIGVDSYTSRNLEVSIGSETKQRFLSNVKTPSQATDAANKDYVDTLAGVTMKVTKDNVASIVTSYMKSPDYDASFTLLVRAESLGNFYRLSGGTLMTPVGLTSGQYYFSFPVDMEYSSLKRIELSVDSAGEFTVTVIDDSNDYSEIPFDECTLIAHWTKLA